MAVPLRQQLAIGRYVLAQRLKGDARYPLVLMLEPFFRCNLACAGCGKIDYPDLLLNKRLSVEECLQAVDECGAPVVSIAGGEPLLHREIDKVVQGIIARKTYVYLCTNALLMRKKLDQYQPTVLRLVRPPRRRQGACTTTRSARTASTTGRPRRSGSRRSGASGSTSTAPCSTTPSPSGSPASSTT